MHVWPTKSQSMNECLVKIVCNHLSNLSIRMQSHRCLSTISSRPVLPKWTSWLTFVSPFWWSISLSSHVCSINVRLRRRFSMVMQLTQSKAETHYLLPRVGDGQHHQYCPQPVRPRSPIQSISRTTPSILSILSTLSLTSASDCTKFRRAKVWGENYGTEKSETNCASSVSEINIALNKFWSIEQSSRQECASLSSQRVCSAHSQSEPRLSQMQDMQESSQIRDSR